MMFSNEMEIIGLTITGYFILFAGAGTLFIIYSLITGLLIAIDAYKKFEKIRELEDKIDELQEV